MRLTECPEAVGEVINVGTDESITINELADKITEMTGSASPKQHLSYEQAYGLPFDDMLVRKADLSKVKRLIDFRARFSLDETLAQVIEYEQARLDRGLEG